MTAENAADEPELNAQRRMAWFFRRQIRPIFAAHRLPMPVAVPTYHPQNFRARLWRWLLGT